MAPVGECFRKLGRCRDWSVDGGVGWLEKPEMLVRSGRVKEIGGV
jgi:hypothetical protein